MKQYKSRDKITQKMTRDGLIEVNETQQTAERISKREQDADFQKSPEQQAAQDGTQLQGVASQTSPLPHAPGASPARDTATAERVMEHIEAAQTRRASKKAVHKAQEEVTVQTTSSRLQFTEEELAVPELECYIEKSNKAADRLDAAKAAIPKQKKLVKERTFDEAAGKAKTRLHFEEQEKPIPGGKKGNPLSRPAQEAGIFVHNKIHSVEKDNSGVEGAHKSEELAERGAKYGARKLKQGYRSHKTLDGCPHLPPEELEKLKADMASSWHLEDKPFATWALSNNSAEIRRVKDRIKSLSQQKEIGFVGWEFDGGKVEANTEANRLQIFFEDKPDEATREALKSNGFRWSPKAGAWQRQLTSNAYYAADYVKAIAPLTGEKPTELQRAHIRQQKVAAQEQPAQEQPEQEAPQDKDTFSIYQIKGGDETRDLRFEPYDRLIAAGHRVDPKNYALVYSAPLTPGTSLEDIYTRFNIDHPKDFKGHSLSVSDVVVLHQNGQDTAHYVDSFGYKKVPEFLQPENYLKTAEQTTEQNYNMIDGQINNTPTVAELEAKVKTGETISLVDLAETVKADKERGKAAKTEKKPSIRAQLKAAKEQTPKKQAKQKTQDLERS